DPGTAPPCASRHARASGQRPAVPQLVPRAVDSAAHPRVQHRAADGALRAAIAAELRRCGDESARRRPDQAAEPRARQLAVGARRAVVQGPDRTVRAARVEGRVAAGRARPRPRDVAQLVGRRCPAPALAQTTARRLLEQTSVGPERAGLFEQLIDLAFPFTLYEQGPFVARGIPALTLTTAGERPPDPFADRPQTLDATKLGGI